MVRNQHILRIAIAGIFLTLPLLSACASLDRRAQTDPDAAAASTLTIQDVWARSDQAGQNSAVYLQITNDGDADDRLIAASTDVATTTEIHDVIADNNVMRMQEVDEISVSAGDIVSLEPGGFHVMLFDLTQDLVAGDEFDLVLTFETAGDLSVTAEVRDHMPQNGHGHTGQGGS